MWKCVKIAGWRFKMLYYFFQNFAINCFKNRHSHFFLRLLSNLCDLCITGRCANLLSDITDLLWKEGSKLIAILLSESISLGIWLGGFVSLSTVAKRVRVLFKLLFIRFEKKVCLAVASSNWKHEGCLYRCYSVFQVLSSATSAQLFCIVFSYSELLLIFSKMIFVCHSSCWPLSVQYHQ